VSSFTLEYRSGLVHRSELPVLRSSPIPFLLHTQTFPARENAFKSGKGQVHGQRTSETLKPFMRKRTAVMWTCTAMRSHLQLPLSDSGRANTSTPKGECDWRVDIHKSFPQGNKTLSYSSRPFHEPSRSRVQGIFMRSSTNEIWIHSS
jgi:hypothetical protein